MSTTSSSPNPDVTRNDAAGRYELRVDGDVVSIAEFSARPDAIVVPYVETDPAHRGKGHSTTLMEAVVADVRERKLKIVPRCRVAREYVSALDDADDLIAR